MIAQWLIAGMACGLPMAFWAGIQIGQERERDRQHAEAVRRK